MQKNDRENEALAKFIHAYKEKFDEEPNLVVAPLVADATMLMLNALSNSNNASDLAKNLSNVRGFQGLSSEISFERGVNSAAAVMKISGQRAVRVK
jgi:ABC-type branched-subunit amino acid transport system substrate-binding protein